MNAVLRALHEVLRVLAFLPRAATSVVSGAPLRDSVVLLLRLIASSSPVVFVVAFFSGAMLTVQAASSLQALGGGSMAGVVVGFGGMREVFPLLAAASVAARSGAEFASELSTLKATQQLDALSVMGLDPLRLLVGPRIIAATFGTPLCVLLACGAGMVGAQVIGHFQLGIDRGAMWSSLWSAVRTIDVTVAVLKGVVLGFVLGAISVREGLVATDGTAGVGVATNRAVIRSMVTVCAASLLITALVYGGLA